MNFVLRPRYILIGILVLAFLVRVVGIEYGLPLWLFDDEPSLVTSALKMLELKTLVPRLHQEEFKQLLYYPPYFSYLLLVPFSVIIGIKYILFSGAWAQFINYLLIDASVFFIMARLISITFGILTIWLIYKTAKQIFRIEPPALVSAFFLAFSITFINISTFAIHWIPATFFVSLALWVITNTHFSFRKRYLLCALIAGIGFGFSIMSIFSTLFIPLVYIFVDKKTPFSAIKEGVLYQAFFIFIALAVIPAILNPDSFGFASDTTLTGNTKTLLGVFFSLFWFLKPIAVIEPILIIFSIIGIAAIFKNKKYREYFYFLGAFLILYSMAFYIGFRFEERFMAPIIPILALIAGYGFVALFSIANRITQTICFIFLMFTIAASAKLAWLKYFNDNRIQARHWIEQNIPPNTKIITYANLTRLSSTPEAITEQESIDNNSLRRADKAERDIEKTYSRTKSFYALNLYTVGNYNFFSTINEYAKQNDYKYFLVSAKPNDNMQFYSAFEPLKERAQQTAYFGKNNNLDYFTSGSVESMIKLFKAQSVGLPVVLYKLNQ